MIGVVSTGYIKGLQPQKRLPLPAACAVALPTSKVCAVAMSTPTAESVVAMAAKAAAEAAAARVIHPPKTGKRWASGKLLPTQVGAAPKPKVPTTDTSATRSPNAPALLSQDGVPGSPTVQPKTPPGAGLFVQPTTPTTTPTTDTSATRSSDAPPPLSQDDVEEFSTAWGF